MGGSVAVHAIEAIALGFLHDLRSDNDIYDKTEAVESRFWKMEQPSGTTKLFFLS